MLFLAYTAYIRGLSTPGLKSARGSRDPGARAQEEEEEAIRTSTLI